MSNLGKIVAGIVLVVVLGGGYFAYTVLRTPEQASAPIEAIPLATTVVEPTAAPTEAAEPTEAPTEAAAEPTDDPYAEATAEATAATETTTEATAEATAAAESEAASSPILAQIMQEESEARFSINEVLNDAPKTVIGTTNQVAGQISVDPSNPANTQVGVIQVNARTLTTDSAFRNRAIANAILDTNTYEFITFTPTAITGLPESGQIGQSYSFQVAGDLTIKDVTKQVTFEVTVTAVSDTRLEGTASATILYADYNISIPEVPQVASVEEDVLLEIDFVATPVTQ